MNMTFCRHRSQPSVPTVDIGTNRRHQLYSNHAHARGQCSFSFFLFSFSFLFSLSPLSFFCLFPFFFLSILFFLTFTFSFLSFFLISFLCFVVCLLSVPTALGRQFSVDCLKVPTSQNYENDILSAPINNRRCR